MSVTSPSIRLRSSLHFAPFQDDLILNHSSGLSSILIPGGGEPIVLSAGSDPFENHGMNANSKHWEPDMISLEFVEASPPNQADSFGGHGVWGKEEKEELLFARMSMMEQLYVSRKMGQQLGAE